MTHAHATVAKNTKNAVEKIVKFYYYLKYIYLYVYEIENYIYIYKEK